MAFALLLAAPIFVTYAETGLVPRFPTAIAAAKQVLYLVTGASMADAEVAADASTMPADVADAG